MASADDYDGELAERYGYVNRAIPDAEFDAFIDAFVTRVSSFTPGAIRDLKQVVDPVTLPPDEEFEIGWALHPQAWGHGYATETGLALARWAFSQGIEQVIALVRPANTRAAATVDRIGMEWVGETEKYHGLRLQEYRLRPADLPAG